MDNKYNLKKKTCQNESRLGFSPTANYTLIPKEYNVERSKSGISNNWNMETERRKDTFNYEGLF